MPVMCAATSTRLPAGTGSKAPYPRQRSVIRVLRGVDAISRRTPNVMIFIGGTMLEHDLQRAETPAQVQVLDSAAASGPNRYGYDQSLWPPRI